MSFASRQFVQALLLVFVLSHVAFGLHATTHASGDAIDCVSCSNHANAPVAVSTSPFEFQLTPATEFACEYSETIAPCDTFWSFNSRGPPQLS